MTDYQQRVVREKEELDVKLNNLDSFLVSEQFIFLDIEEKRRLLRQAAYMRDYSNVLKERIKAFKEDDEQKG